MIPTWYPYSWYYLIYASLYHRIVLFVIRQSVYFYGVSCDMVPSIFSSIVFIRVSLPKIWLCFCWIVRVRWIFVLMRKVVGAALGGALWVGSPKTSGVSIRPLACLFACSLAHLHAPHYSLCSRAPLRSVIRLLAHFAHSLAGGTVHDWMAIFAVFCSVWTIVVWW